MPRSISTHWAVLVIDAVGSPEAARPAPAACLVTFAVEGAGFIAGVDNGSPISMEKFKDNHRKTFYGKCLVVLQNNGEPGGVKVTATADGLEKATPAIKVK